MPRKIFQVLLAISVLILLVGQAHAEDHIAFGTVVTCPAGDPIQDISVYIYWEEYLVDVVQTNYLGQWVYDTTDWIESGLCYYFTLTASIVIGDPDPPCVAGCCPAITLTLPCTGNLAFPDLEFRCGGKIPCPHQE